MTTTNLATLAYQIKQPKLKKAEAQALIEKYFKGAQDDQTRVELAQLYRYFTPAPAKTAKTTTEWVHKAADPSDTRPFLNHSYSDGKRLVATDGARLHLAETDLPVGYYDNKGNLIEGHAEKHTFPQYETLLPSDSEVLGRVFLSDQKLHTIKPKYGKKTVAMEIGDVFIDKRFIDELANGREALCFAYFEGRLAFYTLEGVLLGLIMPLDMRSAEVTA